MRYILLLLPLICSTALAQQKESTVSISCYVNPELYLQAGVIAHASDKAGNISCNGRYVSIKNESGNPFYYKQNTRWVTIKPQRKTVILVNNTNHVSSDSPSILKLNVRYSPDRSGDLTAKIRAISQMNAQSDRIKVRQLGGEVPEQEENDLGQPAKEATAIVNKPLPAKTPEPSGTKASPKTTAKKAVIETKPRAPSKEPKPEPVSKRNTEIKKNEKLASANALGLRIDFGSGPAGFGPAIKHQFSRNLAVDAAVLFFERGAVGLNGQFEHSFPVKNASGLNWYIGIGPQFVFKGEDTATGLVPVTGLAYNIPDMPLNFSLDWRPCFYLSPDADVEAGSFGLSFRSVF